MCSQPGVMGGSYGGGYGGGRDMQVAYEWQAVLWIKFWTLGNEVPNFFRRCPA